MCCDIPASASQTGKTIPALQQCAPHSPPRRASPQPHHASQRRAPAPAPQRPGRTWRGGARLDGAASHKRLRPLLLLLPRECCHKLLVHLGRLLVIALQPRRAAGRRQTDGLGALAQASNQELGRQLRHPVRSCGTWSGAVQCTGTAGGRSGGHCCARARPASREGASGCWHSVRSFQFPPSSSLPQALSASAGASSTRVIMVRTGEASWEAFPRLPPPHPGLMATYMYLEKVFWLPH